MLKLWPDSLRALGLNPAALPRLHSLVNKRLVRTRRPEGARALRVGRVTRGKPLAPGPGRIPALTRDIAALRAIPADGLVSGAQRLLSPGPWPWVLEPLLAP